MRLRNCGYCRKPFEKLNKCYIIRETKRKYGSPLSYRLRFPDIKTEPEHWEWEANNGGYLYLCDECSNKEITLKHSQATFFPHIIGRDYFNKNKQRSINAL